MNQINLSKCRIGTDEWEADEFLRRDGRWVKYEGLGVSAFYPYRAGGHDYFRDGAYIIGKHLAEDIIAVRRDGEVIMGAVPVRDEVRTVVICREPFVDVGEMASLKAENEKLRKIAAHVPGRVYIKAKEDAGFPEVVRAI